jgi:hypothetical protein
MHLDAIPRTAPDGPLATASLLASTPAIATESPPDKPLEWDWAEEHADRARERASDAAKARLADSADALALPPFDVDRRVLRDVVAEHMRAPVARIRFIGAGKCVGASDTERLLTCVQARLTR